MKNVTNNIANWGLLAGFGGTRITSGGYHGQNTGFLLNVKNAPPILGANNTAHLTLLSICFLGFGIT